MKKLTVLGSTGSIGTQTLDVVRNNPDLLEIVALSTHQKIALLYKQIKEFRPQVVAVSDPSQAKILIPEVSIPVFVGEAGLAQLATLGEADLVVNGIVGVAGIKPTLAALGKGKDMALANKETMVAAGVLTMETAKKYGAWILPVDSEPSAIFQCLEGVPRESVARLILTASGGPFRKTPKRKLERVTPLQALKHPTWKMGPKITVDSATLMNKGFEVIEVMHLFEIPPERIDIVVHPESIIHSMVAFKDGTTLAQLSVPDMRIPIQYALLYPQRRPVHNATKFSLFDAPGELTFEPCDTDRFPCVSLAYEAAKIGGTMPAVMCAANDVFVRAFLDRSIGFHQIPLGIQGVMRLHTPYEANDVVSLFSAIEWAEQQARSLLTKLRV
ncbi:MAG: 1-deoxy-D-xylulose-5-phosphate reductoisomerase [bacterium]|nr:1-deoxy-D-xylulose-5-phosphate reductoisomerase [bacterium]MDZ4284579.1 1-deoxy-D-xylulose-5-phosphate reductoisomerase [Patescibacteria group bacterium]